MIEDNGKLVNAHVYVTRWALSVGIVIYHEGTIIDDGKYFSSKKGRYAFVGKNDFALTEAAARVQVAKKVRRRLAALDKESAKLRAIVDGAAKTIDAVTANALAGGAT